MTDEQNKSVGKSPVTGEPVDVHGTKQDQIDKAVKDAVDKGQKIVKDLGDIVRKHSGPPGTP